jgi:AdoMet-dependent heme synthase
MKNKPYDNFRQKIHNSAKNKGFPLRVMFELTYRCNFYCKHCYVPMNYRKKGELETKEVFSILDQLAEIGCFYLGFTGGEPFIRKDILNILWYAKKKGFEIIIYSNGSLIDERISGELALIRPNKVDITIPAISRIAFDKISGVHGSRDKVFKAIELLHKKGVSLGFKTSILKKNEKEIEDIQKFADSLGAFHRLSTILEPRLNGSKKPYQYGSALYSSNTEEIDTGECVLTDSMGTTNLFKCGVGISQAAIMPSGELKMCVMIDHPRYKILSPGTSLREAWEKQKKLVSNIKPDKNYKCDKCKLEPYCKWCPAKSWLQNKTFTCCVKSI